MHKTDPAKALSSNPEVLAGAAFLRSARLFGTTNGWVWVCEKTRG